MKSLYCQHKVRRVTSLDGPWAFYFPRTGTEVSPRESLDRLDREQLHVPGVWEMLPGKANYRGEALAVKTVLIENPGPVRLYFSGVSHTARVFWDGEEVGGHHNAYTAFAVNLPAVDRGRHELRVHVSNAHGPGISALHIPNDYYNYGGLSRPVELHELAHPVFIENVKLTPGQQGDPREVHVEVTLRNTSPQPESGALLIESRGKRLELPADGIAGGSRKFATVLRLDDADLWSPQHPALHDVNVQLQIAGRTVDDLITRTGLRTVRVQGEQILVNDTPVALRGFNRHEDHPDYGCAIPVPLMMKDLELMRWMGANAVRTSHYPNDPRFLELCDEQGFLVWEENHARGLKCDERMNPLFPEQCRECNREMVDQHHNHPSIIMWGILNECSSNSEKGREEYARQLAQIRELDSSRPLTFASHWAEKDLCMDLPDICSYNIYPNWYQKGDPAEFFRDFLEKIEPVGVAGKPLIISETGAGAIPGLHDPLRRAKWSEDRQCDLLEDLLEVFPSHPRVAGVFLWQFCDVRVDEGFMNGTQRPRTMNNKGIVDEYRRPKLAARTVRHHFRAKD
ncbi:MAG: glycoside hydrolase family 2 protein [Candidatus Sumerlaeia bacterium]